MTQIFVGVYKSTLQRSSLSKIGSMDTERKEEGLHGEGGGGSVVASERKWNESSKCSCSKCSCYCSLLWLSETRVNPDLSASSMRKWLDRLITRLGAAEYWETGCGGGRGGSECTLLVSLCFGAAPEATAAVAAPRRRCLCLHVSPKPHVLLFKR